MWNDLKVSTGFNLENKGSVQQQTHFIHILVSDSLAVLCYIIMLGGLVPLVLHSIVRVPYIKYSKYFLKYQRNGTSNIMNVKITGMLD